jgi:hypothetical protein
MPLTGGSWIEGYVEEDHSGFLRVVLICLKVRANAFA